MRTPKKYTKNLKDCVLTKQMLIDCLWSVNKRAKNFRDKEREYRNYCQNMRYYNHYFYDKYNNVEKCKAKKELYYEQKEIMLSILTPVCIHKEQYGFERERIYDYEKRYKKLEKSGLFVWENCYFDHDNGREVWFGDIELRDKPLYHYYLFYDIGGGHTFHTPIDSSDIEKTKLPVIEIEQLETEGHDIVDLISCQFVDKVIELIQSGEYILKLENN